MHTSMSKLNTHLLVTGGPEPRPAPLLRRDNRVSVAAGSEPGLVPGATSRGGPGAASRGGPSLRAGAGNSQREGRKC